MITARSVHRLNELGGRTNNEDSVFPFLNEEPASSRLFMVCDGVGGSEKGEVASHLACEVFSGLLSQLGAARLEESVFRNAVKACAEQFRAHVSVHPSAKGMGTTLTLAYLGESSVYVGWCGDSRVYLVRDGEILFRTKDHSLVANLVASGDITEEEAQTHPRKNVIFRVMNGETPPTDPEFAELKNVSDGDYLLMCSDGLLEVADDNIIAGLLQAANAGNNFTENFRALCEGNTADNYSMYLVQLAVPPQKKSVPPVTSEEQPKRSAGKWLLVCSLVILLAAAAVFYFGFSNTGAVPPGPAQQPQTNVKKDQPVNVPPAKNDAPPQAPVQQVRESPVPAKEKPDAVPSVDCAGANSKKPGADTGNGAGK